jgi:hypothetical protein
MINTYPADFQTINLSNQQISDIDRNFLNLLKKVTHLDLSRNKLSKIPEALISLACRIKGLTINLSDNPILIDGHLLAVQSKTRVWNQIELLYKFGATLIFDQEKQLPLHNYANTPSLYFY